MSVWRQRRVRLGQRLQREHALSKCLHRLMGCMWVYLQVAHCRRSTIFFVVFAFLWNTGFVWPP